MALQRMGKAAVLYTPLEGILTDYKVLYLMLSMAIGSVKKRAGHLLVSTALKRYSLSFFSLMYVSIRRLYISE